MNQSKESSEVIPLEGSNPSSGTILSKIIAIPEDLNPALSVQDLLQGAMKHILQVYDMAERSKQYHYCDILEAAMSCINTCLELKEK